ncbi:MAG TPA: MerR family transcriptional regulator [Syntrophobacteraceae bacterium]|nr:MerR family transcriptional regulator [Syntrophobacteraceae bacterium]
MSGRIIFLTEAANAIGVAPITLKRWLLEGRFPGVKRDRNGWRIFTGEDIRRIKAFAEKRASPAPVQLALFRENASAAYEDRTASFRDSAFNGNKNLPFHRWVPWIAGFSSNFVEDCFRNYISPAVPASKVTILDPFAGVGTTLTEGIMHGYNVVGFEINPYAYLACKMKLSAMGLNASLVDEELQRFLHYYAGRAADKNYKPRSRPPDKFETRAAFFSPEVERKALIAIDFLSNIKSLEVKDLFRLAFGTVMVSFSNYSYEPSLGRRESSGKENILDAPVEQILAAKIRDMSSDIKEFEELYREIVTNNKAQVFNESFFRALDFCEGGTVDLLVTSPPYLNNYHYLRNTRPQLFWLGIATDPKELRPIEHESFGKFWQTVRDRETIPLEFCHTSLEKDLQLLREINSERKTYGGHGWANYAATYFNDSYRFCKLVGQLLKPAGIAVVVIGNSILQGLEIRTDEIFADIGELVGLTKKEIILLRTKRTGSSIVDSSVRAGKAKKATLLYETAVILGR